MRGAAIMFLVLGFARVVFSESSINPNGIYELQIARDAKALVERFRSKIIEIITGASVNCQEYQIDHAVKQEFIRPAEQIKINIEHEESRARESGDTDKVNYLSHIDCCFNTFKYLLVNEFDNERYTNGEIYLEQADDIIRYINESGEYIMEEIRKREERERIERESYERMKEERRTRYGKNKGKREKRGSEKRKY